jgi:hypothetical protein
MGKWQELQGHMDCPSILDDFLNVDQSVPATDNQKENSPSCKHGASDEEQEEKREDIELLTM